MHQVSVLLTVGLLYLTPAQAQQPGANDATILRPSVELLEFLAIYGELDEETYDILEYHALQDSAAQPQESPDDD